MNKSSKIYVEVGDDRKSNNSFGADEYVEMKIMVGMSAKNSMEIGRVSVRKTVADKTNILKFEFKTTGPATFFYTKKEKMFVGATTDK